MSVMKPPRHYEKQMARLDLAEAEIRQRRKELEARKLLQQKLLAWCKQNGIRRTDLQEIYEDLPLTRVSKRQRLHKIEQSYPPKSELVPFGQEMRRRREALKMNRQQLAEGVGKHHSMISPWEQGKFRIKPDDLKKIEEILGVFPDKLKAPHLKGKTDG